MATKSSILAWRISWAEEPGRLYSPWGHKESDTIEHQQHTLVCFFQFLKMFHIIPVLKIMRQNNDKKKKVKVKSLSRVRLCDPMDGSPPGSSIQGFSRQEYWSGLPFPSPGDLPDPGIEPRSPTLQAYALTSEPPGKPKTHQMRVLQLSDHFPTTES